MKKLLSLSVIAIVFIVSCVNQNNPKAVAEKFLDHLRKGEYTEAKKYVTAESSGWIDIIQGLDRKTDQMRIAAGMHYVVTDLNCLEENDSANCHYKSDGSDQKIHLVKRDENWLVEINMPFPKDKNALKNDSVNNDPDNNPKAVVAKFLEHINKGEYAEAKKQSTPESGAWIDVRQGIDQMAIELNNGEKPQNKVEGLKCKELNDRARCKYKNIKSYETVDLVKRNSSWLVEIKSQSPKDKDTSADFTGYQ
jgi:hypothetical protein